MSEKLIETKRKNQSISQSAPLSRDNKTSTTTVSLKLDEKPCVDAIAIGEILDPAREEHIKKLVASHKTIRDFEATSKGLLEILNTQSTGFTIVAKRNIKKGTIVCRFRGEIANLTLTEFNQLDPSVSNYSYEIAKTQDHKIKAKTQKEKTISLLLGHKVASEASLINGSSNGFANIERVPDGESNEVLFRATKDIQEGEEILLDYGKNYHGREDFQPIFPIGSRSIQKFWEQNKKHYTQKPLPLSVREQELLGTSAPYVLVPDYYTKDADAWRKLGGQQINFLPIIEVNSDSTENIELLREQQFITPLMYACAKQDYDIVERISKIKEINVDFVTKNSRSAWSIITADYGKSDFLTQKCRKLAKIIKDFYRDSKLPLKKYRQYLCDNTKSMTPQEVGNILPKKNRKKDLYYKNKSKTSKQKGKSPVIVPSLTHGDSNLLDDAKKQSIPEALPSINITSESVMPIDVIQQPALQIPSTSTVGLSMPQVGAVTEEQLTSNNITQSFEVRDLKIQGEMGLAKLNTEMDSDYLRTEESSLKKRNREFQELDFYNLQTSNKSPKLSMHSNPLFNWPQPYIFDSVHSMPAPVSYQSVLLTNIPKVQPVAEASPVETIRFDASIPNATVLSEVLRLPAGSIIKINAGRSKEFYNSLTRILPPGGKVTLENMTGMLFQKPKLLAAETSGGELPLLPRELKKITTVPSVLESKIVGKADRVSHRFNPSLSFSSSSMQDKDWNDFVNAIKRGDSVVVWAEYRRQKMSGQLNRRCPPQQGTVLHVAILSMIEAAKSNKALQPYVEIMQFLLQKNTGDMDSTITDLNNKTAKQLLLEAGDFFNGESYKKYRAVLTSLNTNEKRKKNELALTPSCVSSTASFMGIR